MDKHHDPIVEAIRELTAEVRNGFQVRQDDIAALRALVRRAERAAAQFRVIKNVLAAIDAQT